MSDKTETKTKTKTKARVRVRKNEEAQVAALIDENLLYITGGGKYHLVPHMQAIFKYVWKLEEAETEILTDFYMLKASPANFLAKVYQDTGCFDRLQLNDRGNSVHCYYHQCNLKMIERDKEKIPGVLVSVRIHRLTSLYVGLVRIAYANVMEAENYTELWS